MNSYDAHFQIYWEAQNVFLLLKNMNNLNAKATLGNGNEMPLLC